jgi:D-alanyl-D-alanine carboxypeptidase/D-alanyl-D-alanine-endopeptidase (penicillin-binding protein 4)
LPKASLLVEEAGKPVIARQADRPMVPASTMKVLTALAAIQRWGLDHRFETRLLRDGEGRLWVQGAGDPYLVSEELDLMARAVRAAGVTSVVGVGADDSLFAPALDIPGRSASDNPYDAPVTALAANFNTLNLRVQGGAVATAEPQTPLTPVARRLGQTLGNGTQRVNLKDKGLGARYFAELFGAKLEAAGVRVTAEPRVGRVPAGAKPLLVHRNTRDLRALLVPMLEYSNNFVANGLFLKLADRGDGGPITLVQAQQAMARWIDKSFRWRDYRVEDGAGLSRGNRLSARQLVDVLEAFAPYRSFLPRQGDAILAKTGTLTGVSTYAGYVNRDGRWTPFSLLINQPVDAGLRKQVAADLARAPDLRALCPGPSC